MNSEKLCNKNHSIYTAIISATKQAKEIKELINTKREDMKLLIDFAIGERKLCSYKPKYVSSEKQRDELFLWSLRQLREQIKELERELSQL